MNPLIRAAVIAVTLIGAPVLAQSAGEKAKATGNDVKREAKKGANRVGETLCTGTKAECAAKKGKHRVEEAKDKVVDEAKEVKDKVDFLKNLMKIVDATVDAIDYPPMCGGAECGVPGEKLRELAEERMIEELEKRSGVPSYVIESLLDKLRSTLVGPCLVKEISWDSTTKNPTQSMKCSFLVCAETTRNIVSLERETVVKWTVSGECAYACNSNATPCCCKSETFDVSHSGSGECKS